MLLINKDEKKAKEKEKVQCPIMENWECIVLYQQLVSSCDCDK